MKCFNLSTNKLVADKLVLKDGFFGRLIGLLSKGSLGKGEGIILKPCMQIHTFFMRFEIDAVFVAKDFTVVKVMENMKPWRMGPFLTDSYYTIEVAGGSLKGSVKKGDNLQFEL